MTDLLRVSLIVLLSLSLFATPGLYIFEGFLHGFTWEEIITTIILCGTEITLITVLCATKNVKTLIFFLIINTVIIIIIFIIEIRSLRNFVESSRQKFNELIEKYPNGREPDDWSLLMSYHHIKDKKCCGINKNTNLPYIEGYYFYQKFPNNCPTLFSTHVSTNDYHRQPCMNIVHDLYPGVRIISIGKMLFIVFMLVLFWIYIILRRPERHRMTRPITNAQRITYPSSTSLNYPSDIVINSSSVSKPPAYQDISQYEKK